MMGLGKARRQAAEPWKLKLWLCPQEDYAQAQQLMDVIVEITGQKAGQLGGKIQPRVCTNCGRWGHTKEHCQEWFEIAKREGLLEDEEFKKVSETEKRSTPWDNPKEYIGINGLEMWKWINEFKRLDERYQAAGGCDGPSGDEWTRFCEKFDLEHPPFPEGRPRNERLIPWSKQILE